MHEPTRLLLLAGVILTGSAIAYAQVRSNTASSGSGGGTVTYTGPIIITSGGTYSGNWQATDGSNAVTIETTAPVTLQNCRIKGNGWLVTDDNSHHANLTVNNCALLGLPPQSTTQYNYGIALNNPTYLSITNNTLTQTGGINVKNADASLQTVQIMYNNVLNIDGRCGDGSGGWAPPNDSASCANGHYRRLTGFVQLHNVHAPNIEIGWNQVVNTPGNSSPEDNISMYQSGGTSASHAKIHDNLVQWSGLINPTTGTSFSGSCFQNDGPGSESGAMATSYVDWTNMICIATNGGMSIANGHDITVTGSTIVSSGQVAASAYTPGGRVAASPRGNGLQVWANPASNSSYGNNSASNNSLAYVRGPSKARADSWLPYCTNCTDNRSIPYGGNGLPQISDEVAEFGVWTKKLSTQLANNHPVGIGSSLTN